MSNPIQVDFSKLFRFLDKWEAALTNSPAGWRAMSIPYYQFISRIFRAQGDPKWEDLAASTKRQRRGKTYRIGVDTGGMRAAVTGGSAPGSLLAFGRNFLMIGTTLKRANWFHYGTTNNSGRPQQPPRPIYVTPDARTTSDMLRAFLHVAKRSAKKS